MAQLSGESSGGRNALRQDDRDVALHSKHKIFLSHSGSQKDFVEQLCVDLERCDRYPFFDKRRDSLPIGENFPHHIFGAIRQCHVGVVILSEEFFTRSKWPMTELVAMVEEAKERRLSFKIVPVFLSMSVDEFHDETKRNEWLSCWKEWALKDKRVNVEEWRDALTYLHPINSLVYDGLGEVKLRKMTVKELRKVVRAKTRLEGRSRLTDSGANQCTTSGWKSWSAVVGLYGMGGIGKTSICKALCNEFSLEFHGRVCHVELERRSREELLREVLKRVTDTSHVLVNGWKEDELLSRLNGGIMKDAVFLAVDNVSDTQASVDEARSYLSASLPPGSIVVATARSKGTLMRVRPYVTESNVLGMPELDVEEAKSLFVASSNFETRSEADEELVLRCVRRCHFRKDDGSGSYQYHPLTLDVLGKQLGCTDPGGWKAQLDSIDEDLFNRSREAEHPIFSILRKSYDTLSREDQLFFVDVALDFPVAVVFGYSPVYRVPVRVAAVDVLAWLGMVHGISAVGVLTRLEGLKRKSLLERLDDGFGTRIGMHDLWRAFCVEESQSGELRRRRWVYGAKGSDLVDASPAGGCWEDVMRMAFRGSGWAHKLERVNFAHFSNVTVLKITDLVMTKKTVLDLSGLIHLKSLEVEGRGLHLLDLQCLPRCLLSLRWKSDDMEPSTSSSLQFIKEVAFLTELQYLVVSNYLGDELPELSRLASMHVASFYACENVKTLTGLSSKLSNLRVLDLGRCRELRSCPGVGDLVALEELRCGGCGRLERLPHLGRLRNLRVLNVCWCPLISEIPGLGDLGALEDLAAKVDSFDPRRLRLPDMRKLSKLRVLLLEGRSLDAMAGLEGLISLQTLEADFRGLAERPSLRHLTQLQRLEIRGWNLEGVEELGNLAMLHTLEIRDCSGVDELPEMRSLAGVRYLVIRHCEFSVVSGVSEMIELESLRIEDCAKLVRLPNLERLTRLTRLEIFGCPLLRGWNCGVKGPGLEPLTSIGVFSQLERLGWGFLAVKELPDLSHFSRLKQLILYECTSLRRLTLREPMVALSELECFGCSSLTTLPDLSYFPALQRIGLRLCEGITTLSSARPLTALRSLDLDGSIRLHALPDLGMFPALEKLSLKGCSELTTLSSSVRLSAVKWLDARGCESLSGDDLEQLRALCPQCEIQCGALPVALVETDVVRSGALESGVGKKWRWWWSAVGGGGVIRALRWIIQTRRRSVLACDL